MMIDMRKDQGSNWRWLIALFWLAGGLAMGQEVNFRDTKSKAEAGDPEAQFRLAMLYDLGIGIPKNFTESGKWYLKAATAGVAEAQFQLGVRYYEHGKKAKENYVTSFSWFYKAANQGMAEAQYNIALMYQLGRGVPTNRMEAYKWYLIAAAQAYPKALMARDTLATDLTRLEASEGERRAATFEPKRTFRAVSGVGKPGDEPKSSGTGFFITDDGYILTNFHVVDGFSSFVVKTKKGTFPAQVVRTDPTNDLALLKVVGTFVALPIGNSSEARLGDAVFTIGFPNLDVQGVEPKLTRGDISSLAGVKDDPRHFQISVPVQPGNSGGPLVAANGNVVGIVTMRLGDWRTLRLTGALPQNVNYAVKSSLARALVDGVPEAARKLKAPALAGSKVENVVKETGEAVGIILSY